MYEANAEHSLLLISTTAYWTEKTLNGIFSAIDVLHASLLAILVLCVHTNLDH